MKKKGLSLLEIIICLIILALVVTGLTQVFLGARRFSIHGRSRLTAMGIARSMLDYLPMQVNATTWNDTASSLSNSSITGTDGYRYCDSSGRTQQPNCPPVGNRTVNNIVYNANYSVQDAFDMRRVTVKVTWNETANR